MAAVIERDYLSWRKKLISSLSLILKGDSVQKILDSSNSTDERSWMSDQLHGSLRYWGRAQWILRKYSTVKAPSGFLRRSLVPAVYSILNHDRMNWVQVIDETVSLIRQKEGKGPAGFANVCLRRVLEQREAWLNPDFPYEGSESEQAEWASLPLWLWQHLLEERTLEETIQFARVCLKPSSIWIRWIGGKPTEDELNQLQKMGWVSIAENSKSFSGGSPVQTIKEFPTHIYVQDISNQKLLERVADKFKPASILDRCAAPGGKSIGLLDLGFKPKAVDSSAERLKLIKSNQERLNIDFEVLTESEWKLNQSQSADSLIWLDAPCSSLGLIRRHPEIRWITTKEDVLALTQVQRALIKESWERLPPEGSLIFTVCSVLKTEASDHLKHLGLDRHVDEMIDLFPVAESDGDGFSGFILKSNKS